MSTVTERPAGQSHPAPAPAEALLQAERLRTEGRLVEAEAICRQLLRGRPDLPEAEHLLGIIAHQNCKIGEAIDHVQRAVKLAPRVALFHANLGEMLRLAGRPKLAAEAAHRALEIEPKMTAALSNLGVALYELKDYEAAARAQREAIAVKPDFAEAHSNLGNALHALRRFDEAVPAYRRAVTLNPNFADGWANLGTTLHHAGDFDEAMIALRRAIALAPGHANARSGLGILLLMHGDFGEGWDEYEWRLQSTERKGPRFPERPWQGESLNGTHIYVQAEQGFGDSLQFARYLPLLAARGARVTLRVHQQLVTLLRESLPGITVLGDRGDPEPYQSDAVLLSLPRLLKTRRETIPAPTASLRAPAAIVQHWQQRFAPLKGLKVGLCWAGNPEHVNDSRRSLDLETLEPLLKVSNAAFVSLQAGNRAVDLKKPGKTSDRKSGKKADKTSGKAGPAVIDLASDLNDFADTAGAATALDLVITVDTSVAHVAGALGKPVWVLLPWVTDWRWGLGREDCPWYPTMRLFRQQKGEAWSTVIARVAKELKAASGGDAARLMPFKAEGERRAAQADAIIAAEARTAQVVAAPARQLTPAQALMLAEQKRRRGFLGDADDLTRRATATEPDNAEAEHMLGIIAHQSGKLDEAITHIRRAIAIKSDVALYHANLGEMCRLAGRADEAIAAGQRALELDPKYAGAMSNVGIALFDQGKFDEALSYYDRAVALDLNFAQAFSNRGNALQRLKRFADAEMSYRRALELQPSFTDGWNNLGTCLRELKRPDEAETVYRKALELGPNNPETLDNLALALKDLERLDEAAELLRRALVIEARSDKFYLHYGTILLDLNKTEEASAAAKQAVALNPDSHDAVNLMGRVAFAQDDPKKALEWYRRALAIKPDLADALNNLGNVLKELGQLDEAKQAYEEALRIDPDIAGVYVNLADSRKFAPGDPYLAEMERIAAKTEGLSSIDRMQIDFALGKAYADLKDYDRSIARLLAGSAAKRAKISYDERATFALFDRIEAVFSAGLIRAKSGGGDPSAMPIFVMGMPRSGTTLVEQIIASHPLVSGAGELKNLNEVIVTVRDTRGNVIPYPEFVPAADAPAFQQIGERYLASLQKLADGKNYVTDKMPSNYYFAGLVHLALPNAAIIHTVRNPVDTCLSCFSKLFSAEQNHTYDLAELGRYHKRYQQLMAHWHRVLPAGRILDVRYEELIADFEPQAKRIIAHCGLPWDERCLSFHKTERPIRTASANQVRQPIYTSSVGRWRVYGQRLQPLLDALDIAAEA